MASQQDPWAAFNPEPPPAAAPADPADPWAAFSPEPPRQAGDIIREGVQATASRAGRFADNLMRQAARGASFGLSDEIAAGMRSITGGPSYDQALTEERARDREFEQQHPYAATAAQFAGGSLLPFGVAARAASLPGAMARMAGLGALFGGATGFGEGEGGALPRAASAGIGAGIGAGVGAMVPGAVTLAGAAGSAIGRRLGLTSPTATAERIVARDLARDGMTPQELVDSAGRTGKPEVLADMGGENLASTAQTIARLPGPAREQAARLVEARGGQAQGERLAQDVRTAISGDDFRTEVDALLQQRSQGARPLYERAWNLQVPKTVIDNLEPITNSPIGQDALKRGIRVLEEEGRAAYAESVRQGQPDPRLLFDPESAGLVRGENGEWALQGRMQNLRLLDAVKRGMDEIVSEARDPVTGRLTQFGRAVEIQRSNLVGYLREHPHLRAYGQALDAWAGPSALMDSMRLGRRMVSEGAEAADRSAAEIAKLSPSEREFFRVGVARGLLDRLEGAVDNAEVTRINRIFGTPAIRNRLRAAFDSDAEYEQFADMLQREARMAATNRFINPRSGSPTMPLAEKRGDLASPPPGAVTGALIDPQAAEAAGGSVAQDLLRAGVGGGLTGPAFRVFGRIGDVARQRELERNAGALGGILFNPDPASRQAAARAILERQLRDQALGQAVRPLLGGAVRGGAITGGLLSVE